MVNDQEPRYRLVDSNGNVVGSLFQNADGNVEIQDETGTGSVFGPDGIVTPAIDANVVNTEDLSTGRNYQDLTESRALDTQEINDTDSEIIVIVQIEATADNTEGIILPRVDGESPIPTPVRSLDTGERLDVSWVVPSGSTYEADSAGDTADYNLANFVEFRT